jgi:uncharacterized membrane protein
VIRNDERLERVLARILRVGVLVSSACLLAGLAFSYAPLPAAVGAAFLRAGLVLLLATPITRVAASAVSYLVSRDWLFVGLTTVVLVELLAAVLAITR